MSTNEGNSASGSAETKTRFAKGAALLALLMAIGIGISGCADYYGPGYGYGPHYATTVGVGYGGPYGYGYGGYPYGGYPYGGYPYGYGYGSGASVVIRSGGYHGYRRPYYNRGGYYPRTGTAASRTRSSGQTTSSTGHHRRTQPVVQP